MGLEHVLTGMVTEVFPLSMRAKGVSFGGSSNWVSPPLAPPHPAPSNKNS